MRKRRKARSLSERISLMKHNTVKTKDRDLWRNLGGEKVHNEEAIDFVITWVDGNDERWRRERSIYSGKPTDEDEKRYRDWGLLKYWFRGVEKYAPWVRKIHFVTCGQTPTWLNTENEKLSMVCHKEYIPEDYLPTFNSNCIELNMHRIQDLAENYVLFNDDMFLCAPVKQKDFFKDGIPRDSLILHAAPPNDDVISGITFNDVRLINRFFSKSDFIIRKAFSPCYGVDNFRTLVNMPYHMFVGFYETHCPHSFKKHSFEEIWSYAREELDATCKYKFRNASNVNQWLVRYWQLASGNFVPRSLKFSAFYSVNEDIRVLKKAILGKKTKAICINDADVTDFGKTKQSLIDIFETALPNKSSFEK